MKLDKITAKGAEHLYRHPKTGIVYFRQFKKGVGEVTKSTRTNDLSLAKIKADEFKIAFLKKDKIPKYKTNPTALELFEKWLLRKETLGAAGNTITSIKASRKYFDVYFRYMLPEEITAEWWESVYIPETKELTKNPGRKFFNDRKWLIAFLRQLKDDGALMSLPTIRKVDRPTKVGKVYADEEIESLLNFAQNPDIHLAILMAVTMGMRRAEIFQLSIERIDLKKQVIHLRADDTKTKRSRSFAISNDCWPLIKQRCVNNRKWLFQSKFEPDRHLHLDGFHTAWINLKRTTAITGRFHDLRHTFLTKAFKSPDVNPALICYYAGLSMEVAERVYLHFSADDTTPMKSIVSYSEKKIGDIT